MGTETDNNTIDRIILAIENNELVLPTMPDWAVEVQQMLADPDVPTNQIILVICRDPVLSAQLIMTANSAIYSGLPKVTDMMSAVTRLGYSLLRSLIMKVTLARLANAGHPAIQRLLSGFMDHSQEVAAISYILARDQPYLSSDEAMLAGLIHDIGALPICMHADMNGFVIDEHDYNLLIRKYSGQIGEKLLRAWSFRDELVEVPAAVADLQHGTEIELPSYADIVTVANLLSRPSQEFDGWDDVQALRRLGLSPETCRGFDKQMGEEVRSVREIFFDNYL